LFFSRKSVSGLLSSPKMALPLYALPENADVPEARGAGSGIGAETGVANSASKQKRSSGETG
jgi:hypothetical protein